MHLLNEAASHSEGSKGLMAVNVFLQPVNHDLQEFRQWIDGAYQEDEDSLVGEGAR
jgi:hypothetical protein